MKNCAEGKRGNRRAARKLMGGAFDFAGLPVWCSLRRRAGTPLQERPAERPEKGAILKQKDMGWAEYYSARCLALRRVRQLLYPRRCPFCGRVLGDVPACGNCAAELARLERKPSKRLDPAQHYFGALDGAAAAFSYTGCVRQAVLRTKYAGEAWNAEEMGCWIARLLFQSGIEYRWGTPVPGQVPAAGLEYDWVVPVPASGRGRGYNVPQQMALPIARALNLPLHPLALCRVRAGRRQAGLPLDERMANVAGAFCAQQPQELEGKRILLVDDVITTGATAAACAQALLDAGAQSVFAVALAAAGPDEENS